MHSVSPSRVASATSSTAARPSRRSGHSMMSSGSRDKPSRPHSSSSSRAALVSMSKCTARRSSGARVARVLQGPRGGGVEPVHQDHHHVAAQDRGLGHLHHAGLEQLGLLHVLVVQPDEPDIEERAHHHDEPGALLELRDGEDQDDGEGQGTPRSR